MTVPNANENVEQLVLSSIADGNAGGIATSEKHLAVLYKGKQTYTYHTTQHSYS